MRYPPSVLLVNNTAHVCHTLAAIACESDFVGGGQERGFMRANDLVSWVKEQYELQVVHRPDVNVHKRTLHEVWTQVAKQAEVWAAAELADSQATTANSRYATALSVLKEYGCVEDVQYQDERTFESWLNERLHSAKAPNDA